MSNTYCAIDLFSGCGGLSEGLFRAGFFTKLAIEIDSDASATYSLNHPNTYLIQKDIRKIKASEIKNVIKSDIIHLLAGCPPCQGFSAVRRLNKKHRVKDKRNTLIREYLRLIKELKPLTIMMENVPALEDYHLFKEMVDELDKIGYHPKYDIVRIDKYGVPQRRRRLVLVGSLLGNIEIAPALKEKATVKDFIGNLEPINNTQDELHKIVARHSDRISKMISLIPKNGGSRKDLPNEYILSCHKKSNVGFNDIYGRLRWDDCSSTITGGCLNPSKGRFLHPEENRCISAREAALLQTFPRWYKFPVELPKDKIALMIGNALPPKFSYIQSRNIYEHLQLHLVNN